MSSSVLDALVGRLRATADYNANAGVAPAVVLWPDEGRQWVDVVEQLRGEIPLVVLGDFEPERCSGPAYWLRCAIAGAIDCELPAGTPTVYLPGVARSQLRAVESCPAELAPIAELQYRAHWFTHANGKGWTVRSFLANEEHGLGLNVADDEATTQMMRLAVQPLLELPLDRLDGQWLDAEFFADLVNPDPVRMVLGWIDDPAGTRGRLDEAQWVSFVQQCKADYSFDPGAEGELAAARNLGERQGKWAQVWKRFAETPDRYPGVVARLRQAKPMEFTFDPHPAWPQDNEAAEDQLRNQLHDFAALTAEGARKEAAALEDAHAWRRGTVWAALNRAPLAFAVEQVARLAELTSKPLASASTDDLRVDYTERAWEADEAFTLALAAVPDGPDRTAVGAAVTTIYGAWADQAARALQALVGSTETVDDYACQEPEVPAAGSVTLFVDGLRLDIAHRIAERLRDANFDVEIDTKFAALPTVTETAKPSIMPVEEGTLGAGPDLYPAATETGTRATIQVTRGLIEKRGVQVLATNEVGDPSGSAWAEAGEIDHRGHDVGVRLVDYLDEEVDRIVRRVRELRDAGWGRVQIVTDHGWLLLPGGMPKVELPVATTEEKKGRCARLKDGAAVDVPTIPWRWDPDVRIAVAAGLSCFEANKTYEHGGISPQECIIPVVTATPGAALASQVMITKVKWLGLLCRIEFSGAPDGIVVDLRALAADPNTSIAEVAKKTSSSGRVSLVVPDEEHEGEKVHLVLVSGDGTILAQRELTVGRNQ